MEPSHHHGAQTVWKIVLRVVLVLLPSLLILGVIFRLNHPRAIIPDTIVEASILCETDASGTPELFGSSALKSLDQLLNEGTFLPDGMPVKPSDCTTFSLVIRTSGSSGEKLRRYTLYVPPADPDTGTYHAYFSPDNAAFYRAPQKPLNSLLLTDYLRPCYEEALFPVLTSSADEIIQPTAGEWSYRDIGNNDHTYAFNRTEVLATYEQTGSIRFTFSTEPTACRILILNPDGETIFNGSETDLEDTRLSHTETLEVLIHAEWSENRSGDYHFFLNYLAPAQFTMDTTSAKPGGFVLFRATNVTTPSRLMFASTPNIGTTPVFYPAPDDPDNTILCVVPLASSLEEGGYSIVFSYNGTSHTFRLPISHTGQKNVSLSLTDSQTVLLRSEQLQRNTNELIRKICVNESGIYCLYDGITTAGSLSGIAPAYRFSDTLIAGKETFKANQTFYQCAPGTAVPASAGGKIARIVNDPLLGLCVVIDHGKNIRTWYLHLGDVHVEVGQTVVSGSVLGRVGDTGLTDSVGFGYTATVGDMLIDPETLPDLVRILNGK